MLSVAGLLLLTILPEILPSAFAGILISVMVYAIGGGLLEVIVSPVVEACPSDNKEKAMSMLHSFYCWGHVGVVLLSTVFFFVFGIENWKIMAVLWALIPLANAFIFAKVPVPSLIEEGEQGLSLKELFGMKMFWILLIMMVCAGASEQAVSQWASTFAEKGLRISKVAGDLAGPMAFAILMGTSRAFYGKYGDRIQLDRFMRLSCVLCIASYLGIAFFPTPLFSLISCAVCGFSVGIMWPGTFSKAAKVLPKGGTAMFALLALGGDLGCSSGPTVVGAVSSLAGEKFEIGYICCRYFFQFYYYWELECAITLRKKEGIGMEFLKCSPKWTREPKKYVIQDGKVVITTEKGTDLWARTYYGFQNDNAPVLQIRTEEQYFSFIVKTEFDGGQTV